MYNILGVNEHILILVHFHIVVVNNKQSSIPFITLYPSFKDSWQPINDKFKNRLVQFHIVKLRRGSGKDRQGMAVKAKGLKA